MTVEELLNLGDCGAGNALGFNTDQGCADLLKAAHSIWMTSPNVYLDPVQTLDSDYVKTLQKEGKLIVIKGITQFQENGNDDAIETLEDDTQEVTNKGKYKFLAMFKKGLYFNRALGSIEGYGGWRTIIVDKQGNILMTSRADGGAKGFTTGMIRRTKLSFPTNTESLKQGLEWQLTERHEIDDNYIMFKNSNLPFDPRDVEPVIQAYISIPNNPVNTETTITAKIVVDRGRKDVVSGADYDLFLNTIDGTTSNPTAGDDSTTEGIYPLTVPALSTGQKGSLRFYDNANNSPIIEIPDFGLVKSNVATYTVA